MRISAAPGSDGCIQAGDPLVILRRSGAIEACRVSSVERLADAGGR